VTYSIFFVTKMSEPKTKEYFCAACEKCKEKVEEEKGSIGAFAADTEKRYGGPIFAHGTSVRALKQKIQDLDATVKFSQYCRDACKTCGQNGYAKSFEEVRQVAIKKRPEIAESYIKAKVYLDRSLDTNVKLPPDLTAAAIILGLVKQNLSVYSFSRLVENQNKIVAESYNQKIVTEQRNTLEKQNFDKLRDAISNIYRQLRSDVNNGRITPSKFRVSMELYINQVLPKNYPHLTRDTIQKIIDGNEEFLIKNRDLM